MADFYLDVVKQLGLAPEDSVLVVCGGAYDKRVLEACGVKNVVISNVDYHDGVASYEPYRWEFQDAESLTAPDGHFDWVMVHAGLHHCASPHKALCEMLRVSRKGVLIVEARDSLLMRMAVRFGLTGDYELEPALLSGGKYGGYRNTPIPNYIYRWTEREFEKTVASYMPHEAPRFRYHYGYRLPVQRMAMSRNPLKRAAVGALASASWVLEKLVPRQGNCFGMVMQRTGAMKPWMQPDRATPAVDLDYIGRLYDPSKYKKG